MLRKSNKLKHKGHKRATKAVSGRRNNKRNLSGTSYAKGTALPTIKGIPSGIGRKRIIKNNLGSIDGSS